MVRSVKIYDHMKFGQLRQRGIINLIKIDDDDNLMTPCKIRPFVNRQRHSFWSYGFSSFEPDVILYAVSVISI